MLLSMTVTRSGAVSEAQARMPVEVAIGVLGPADP
jgi:hypothetical protein